MINDSIDILDAKICNIGINYTIVAEAGKNKYQIIDLCSRLLRRRYRRLHDIGEPFYITEIYSLLSKVDGVADVVDVNIEAKTTANYSSTKFDFASQTTLDGRYIKVPDNVILEVKFPFDDIKGTAQ